MDLYRYLLNSVRKKDLNNISLFEDLNLIRDESYSSLLHHADSKEVILYLSKKISINNFNNYLIPSGYYIIKNVLNNDNNNHSILSIIRLLFYIGCDFSIKNMYNNENILDLVINNPNIYNLIKKYKDIQDNAFIDSGYVNYYYKLMMWINLSIIYLKHPNLEIFYYFKPHKDITMNFKLNYELLSLLNFNWNAFILNYMKKKENKLCLNCGEIDNLKKCLKCKKVYYCSPKCQRETFYLHKNFCFVN